MATAAGAENAAADRAARKPRDVEEFVDYYVHRRLADLLIAVLVKTRVTPDQVTFSSGLTAIVGGVVIGTATPERPLQAVAGFALFLLSVALDCADGQLARIRGVSSYAGRALDGYVDVVSVASIMFGQLAWLLERGVPFWLTQVVGWTAAYSFKWHAHSYDHVKNIYLYNVEGPKARDNAFPSLEEIDREREEHERAGRWFGALLCRGFRHFTLSQRKGLSGVAGLDRPPMQTPEQRRLYRERFRSFMRLWTFNGMGTHMEILMVSCLLMPIYPLAPLVAWGFLALPMNLFTVYLKLAEKRLQARLADELSRAAASLA